MVNPNNLKFKIIAILVCVFLSLCFIYTVSAQASSTVMTAAASTSQPAVGSTLTVTIKISNVQNLAGIDTTLQWNPSVLSLSNVALNLGVESHSDGVLHGNKLNYDYNSLATGDIYVNETKVSGSYELVAQSIGASTPAFSGSGTIATLTFNVMSTGSAGLSLQADLADHPVAGENANLIDHTYVVDSVNAVATNATPTPTNAVPEFPSVTIITVFIALATVAIVLTVKKLNKK